MYIVLHVFDDLQDTRVVGGIKTYHRYLAGEEYPREGYTPTPERIAELAGSNNAQKRPIIAVKKQDGPTVNPAPETPADAPTAPKKAPATRKRAAPAKRKATPKKEG